MTVDEARYCTCGTRLARDNRHALCTPCQKRSRNHLAGSPIVPLSFWNDPALRAALDAWHIGQVIRAYRLHPFHVEPIAQSIVANWFDMTQAQLSRIENGTAVTDLAKLIPWANTLGIPADLLWFKLLPGKPMEQVSDTTALPVSPTSDGGNSLAIGREAQNTTEEEDVQRRTLLQSFLAGAGIVGSASAMASLGQLDQVRQRLDTLLEGSDISGSTVARWEALPSEYGQRYQVIAPGQLLTDVANDFVQLHYALGLRQSAKQRMMLTRTSGQLAVLAGIFLAAMGERQSAQAWFHTAGLAASEADDSQLAGLALVRSGIVNLYHGAPDRALGKLVKANVLLGSAPTPWRVRALVVEARALAKLGQHQLSEQRLIEAEDTFQDMPASALSDPALGYTERQFYFTVGNAYTHLGKTAEADDMQRQALALYQASEYLDPALIRLDQAQCLVVQGDVSSACDQAVQAIAAVPEDHRGLVVHYGRSFFADLPANGQKTAAGATLREALLSC